MLISTKRKICSYDGFSCMASISSFTLCIKLVKVFVETSLCGYQHLLTTPKIWGSAEQKRLWRSTRPFFCRHQTKTEKSGGTRLEPIIDTIPYDTGLEAPLAHSLHTVCFRKFTPCLLPRLTFEPEPLRQVAKFRPTKLN